jgi:mannosyltransferase
MNHVIQKLKLSFNGNSLLIVSILLLGFLLRIYNLSGESLWLDEGHSVNLAHLSIQQLDRYLYEVYPPLYFLFLHFWIGIFGDSEFSIRFPSVIFGVLSIFMMYKMSSLLFNKNAGIISSLLLSLSIFHIYYSQEARAYTLMVLLTLLSMYCFVRILRQINLIESIGYILFSTLLLYTHYFGSFVIIAQNIYVFGILIFSKRESELHFRKWILLQSIIAIIYLPWLFVLIHQLSHNTGYLYWISIPTITSLWDTLREYSGSQFLSGSRFLFWLYIILLSLSLLPLRNSLEEMSRGTIASTMENHSSVVNVSSRDSIYLLLAWFLSPLLLPFLFSHFVTPIYYTRYTISASLAFYILITRGIQKIKIKYIKFIVLIIIITLSIGSLDGYYTKVHKQQWREVARYIETREMPGDTLFYYPDWLFLIIDYYSKNIHLNMKPLQNGGQAEGDLSLISENHDRIWLITSFYANPEEFRKKLRLLQYHFSDYKEFDGEGSLNGSSLIIKVYLFKKSIEAGNNIIR